MKLRPDCAPRLDPLNPHRPSISLSLLPCLLSLVCENLQKGIWDKESSENNLSEIKPQRFQSLSFFLRCFSLERRGMVRASEELNKLGWMVCDFCDNFLQFEW
ncbi:hypothetical protein M758_UG053000 [Ceratodon purpureus]|nr:hypothetical protein M758_UG053000 [Ceratodon purpureus]